MSSFYSFPGEPGFFRESAGRGWLLVGDAGYFRDPLTAHGITDALRDAELAARAILRGRESALAEYPRERDEIATRMFEISDDLASFSWDLPTARLLHEDLAREMSHEVAALSRPATWALPALNEARSPSSEPAGVL
jgi:flavin-dependent dehydrogenase